MRLTREQIDRICAATLKSDADIFYLDEATDGRLLFGAIEIVERQRPLKLTPEKLAADERVGAA